MKIIRIIKEMKAVARELKSEGKTIGFVPTMGYLHEGHISLVKKSVQMADVAIVSIFVNPTQFGPREDFKEYPRDIKRDLEILEREGVDFVFFPDENEMYPNGYKTYIEVHDLDKKLCGRSRPGHFKGVCTVVLKLFNIVDPDMAFFGQKDAQQAIILKKMIEDLDLDVRLHVLPIVRDKDGLALSSRNEYLNPEERKAALVLRRSLQKAKEMIKEGERKVPRIIQRMMEIIGKEPLARVDYVEIVDLDELNSPDIIEKRDTLIALAVFMGKTRLIDNMMVKIKNREVKFME
ncbi:MAG: pantoate--beta-alanine ligase [Candidatus Aminicenantaceae bacterium]